MPRVQAWGSNDFKVNLEKRLKSAKRFRERFEEQWRLNERTCFYHNSRNPNSVTLTEDNLIRVDNEEVGQMEQVEMAVNYAWKFLRFIHSQMSANPPSVVVRPESSDTDDKQKADAADRIVRYAYQQEDIQEVFDQANLKTLTYGTGYVRVYFDNNAGEALSFDKSSGDLTMTGEICVYTPSTWDIWLDPSAKSWKDIRFFFERIEYTMEEAKFRWPEKADALDQHCQTKSKVASELEDWRTTEDVVQVYYYCERELPINGMAGRMAVCLEDGTLLAEATENTNPDGGLGLAYETDVDIPDQVYGASFIQYVYKLQELLNRLDTNFVDNIAAHNVVRMVLPDEAEVEDMSLSNSAWDYVKISGMGNATPHFVPAASLMPDAHKLRENLISGIQELAGVNDSMQGVQKREMSGFSMQTAIDAGNTIRRRLFNKYTACVRDVFKMYLGNAKDNWNEPRTIRVLGKEKAFEVADFKGADIDHGYDLVCEYGASLSLDPARRREEIMQLMPVFEKAGVPTKTILSKLKLNELEPLYDRMELAAERQREEIEEMISTRKPVKPRDLQDHAGMLDYAYFYVMTATYKYLDPDVQQLITDHIKIREEMAKQTAANGKADPTAAAQAALQPPPAPGAPAPGGPTGLPATVLTQGNPAPGVAPAA